MFQVYRSHHFYLIPVLVVVVHGGLLEPPSHSCHPDSCAPTAKCVDAGSYVYCECPPGKTGENCTMDDPCLPQTENCPGGKFCFGPCEANVVCMGATGEAHCTGCVAGWTGAQCDMDIDECSDVSDVCANGGTCINEEGDFRCVCTPGWKGKECRCKQGDPCEDDIEQNLVQTTPPNGIPNLTISFGIQACLIIVYALFC